MNINGEFDPSYQKVVDAFALNFEKHEENGAALAIVKDNQVVVDVWAGFRDEACTKPWQQDTLVNVWSVTKGVVAACVAMLVDRGLLDYQQKVSYYWPEFAQQGKSGVTVQQLLSHQAGLCGLEEGSEIDALYDVRSAAETLAAMPPLWPLDEGSGYHAFTIGCMLNELFIRTDGRSIKQFFEQELVAKLGLDIHLGLPQDRADDLASIVVAKSLRENNDANAGKFENIAQQAAFSRPSVSPDAPNTEQWQQAEIGAANGHSNARSLAKLYGILAVGGSINEQKVISSEAIEQATRIAITSKDLVLGEKVSWAAGFERNSSGLYGPCKDAYGHPGWGGSFAFADPDQKLGFSYTMNRMSSHLAGDPRNLALIKALYS